MMAAGSLGALRDFIGAQVVERIPANRPAIQRLIEVSRHMHAKRGFHSTVMNFGHGMQIGIGARLILVTREWGSIHEM